MLGNAKSVRPHGVIPTSPAGNASGTPQTLIGITDAKFVVIGFYDERGVERTMVAMDVGGKLYAPPNAIEWCASMRPVSKWLSEQVNKKLLDEKVAREDIPNEDSDNVLGE